MSRSGRVQSEAVQAPHGRGRRYRTSDVRGQIPPPPPPNRTHVRHRARPIRGAVRAHQDLRKEHGELKTERASLGEAFGMVKRQAGWAIALESENAELKGSLSSKDAEIGRMLAVLRRHVKGRVVHPEGPNTPLSEAGSAGTAAAGLDPGGTAAAGLDPGGTAAVEAGRAQYSSRRGGAAAPQSCSEGFRAGPAGGRATRATAHRTTRTPRSSSTSFAGRRTEAWTCPRARAPTTGAAAAALAAVAAAAGPDAAA